MESIHRSHGQDGNSQETESVVSIKVRNKLFMTRERNRIKLIIWKTLSVQDEDEDGEGKGRNNIFISNQENICDGS